MVMEIDKVKVVVMVPEGHLETVRNAMFSAGAGIIGNYSNCSISTKCNGTFFANDGAAPYLGNKSTFEEYEEIKLEAICEPEKLSCVLSAIRKSHPYEEPGIDIFPLIDPRKY